jgi:hypothetical protein
MNVRLQLIILYVDLSNGSHGCLLDDDLNIISRPLDSERLKEGLRDILLEFLDIHPDWVKLSLIDVLYNKDEVSIVYSCMVPIMIAKNKGHWKQIGEINDQFTKNLVFVASQKTF